MSDERQQWYGGLGVRATRPMSPEELQELLETRREAIWKLGKALALLGAIAIAALFVTPRAFLLVGFGILLVADRHGEFPRMLFVLARFLRTSREDVRNGVVVLCDQNVEALRDSGLLWRRDGAHVYELALLTRAATAAVPEHALLAARFLKPVEDNTTMSVHQRPLSDDEVAELESRIPAVALTRAVLLAFAIASAIAGLLGAARFHPGFLVLTLVAALALWRLVPSMRDHLRLRNAMRRDVHERAAVIVQASQEAPILEVLPHSNILWTDGAVPAPWRRAA